MGKDTNNRAARVIYVGYFFEIDNMTKVFFKEIGETIDTNKPILLTVENWEEHKYTFKEKRFKQIKYSHFTDQEIIGCEVEELQKLSNILSEIKNFSDRHKNEIIILSRRYKNLLQNIHTSPPQQNSENQFSVLEWTTIFYYADETKLLYNSRKVKDRMEQFMKDHGIKTTFQNFKSKYYEAKRRINKKSDYPIQKLKLIIPFLNKNYQRAVTRAEEDIIYLEEEQPEY